MNYKLEEIPDLIDWSNFRNLSEKMMGALNLDRLEESINKRFESFSNLLLDPSLYAQ
jgi:hypothetical protein